MQISISKAQEKKYHLTWPEFSLPYKSAFDLMSNFNFILTYGSKRLDFGMRQWAEVDQFPPFDPDDPYFPYETKNLYFSATNAIHMCESNQKCPWTVLPSCLSEKYFDHMLKKIKDYEHPRKKDKKSEYRFNKGMVYANLGVAQAAQMKIDEGFANILKALDEDRRYLTKPSEYELFLSKLFTQFEDKIVKRLSDYVARLGIKNDSKAPKFVDEFLASLTADQRAFFDYTFARIMQNWDVWHDKENRFTSNRLLAYIQDLCLFAEDLLKGKGFQDTLRPMIKTAFGIKCAPGRCEANRLKKLEENLCQHFKETDPTARCLRILLTLRNFSSHNISGGTKADYFYKKYENILMEILGAIFKIYGL